MAIQNNKLYQVGEFARLPIPRADMADEFREACARAEAKGNRARELLNECLPDPELVKLWAKDYEVTR